LTPSRWALESRPFLEDPKPFLCAISIPRPDRSLAAEVEKSNLC
jgi:hypothetical protein